MTSSFQHIILNVDDHEGLRYAKTKIFERAGYRVLEAGTGIDALKLVNQERPHLVLLDVGLPDINGLEVCRQIKTNASTAQIMVLQVSATCVRPEERVMGLAGGADVYLTEPVESAELLGAAKALLRLYERDEETRVLVKELTERERFVKSLVDAMPSTVFIYDLLTHRNLFANAKSDALLGYTLEELLLVDQEALKAMVHQKDLPHVLDSLTGLPHLRDGEVLEFECRVQHHSLEWHWVTLRNVVFARDVEGRPIQILGTVQDITERKQNELARIEGEQAVYRAEQRWTVTLEHKVTERTHELLYSQTRLRALASELTLTEQRERQRIAKELHDYLAQLLVVGQMKLNQAKREKMTPRLLGLTQELEGVLSKALTYARSLVAELHPPILRELGFAVAIKWLADQLSQQELIVAVDCDAALAVREDQAVLLFHSVRELLINVSKHSGTAHARVSVWLEDGMLHLCVSDDGAGINSAYGSATDKATKFGLFSIRERMEDLGGRMSVVSAPGQGTKVTLVVPHEEMSLEQANFQRAPESKLRQVSPAPSEFHTAENGDALRGLSSQNASKTSPTRVLLVDDHTMVRQGLRKVLEEYTDMEVVGEATDGEQGVTLAKSLTPDVVIMDVNMPGVSGIAATHQLMRELPHTIVIGLSVDNNKEVEKAMRDAGAISFLTKDAAIEQLYETILQALRLPT
ncbi:MAG: response regulator [Nitrospiraceae bacterium]